MDFEQELAISSRRGVEPPDLELGPMPPRGDQGDRVEIGRSDGSTDQAISPQTITSSKR